MRLGPLHRRYTFTIFVLVGGMLALLTALSLLADPYGVYQRSALSGINDSKPSLNRHEWVAKAFAIENQCARMALFGSSKTLHGLSAQEYFQTPESGGQAFNFGIGFPSIVEISDFFRHAHSVCKLGKAAIGLDFFMFNAAYLRTDRKYRLVTESRASGFLERQYFRVPIHSSMLLGQHSAADAFKTIFASANGAQPMRAADWTMSDVYYQEKVRQAGGYRESFLNEAASFAGYVPAPSYRFSSKNASGVSMYAVLDDLTRFAKKEGIELSIFILPAHAFELAGLQLLGIWPEFETFKREVTGILSRHNSGAASSCSGVVDFAQFNDVSSEPIPVAGSTANMNYWWESTHFKKAVGHMLISRLKPPTAAATNPKFGECMNLQNVERLLSEQRAARDKYIQSNPTEVNATISVLHKVLPNAALPHLFTFKRY